MQSTGLSSRLQHHSSKASVLQLLAFFILQFSHGVSQVQVEEGKREKERVQGIKRIPFFQRNTPTSVPTPHTPIHDAGVGCGAGRLKDGRAHPQLTGATRTLSTYLLKQRGPLCQKDWPNGLGKRPAQLVVMKVVPGDQRTGPGGEPGGHKGDKEIRHEWGPGVPVTVSRGRKMTFSLPRPTLKDTKEGSPPLQASHTSHSLKPGRELLCPES